MKMSDNSKRSVITILVVCAVVFVAFYGIVNLGTISGVVKSFLSVMSPIIIGFAIAYVLNPILRLFEFHAYKRIKSKNLLRGLSIASTYVVALLLIVAFFWLIIPSLITAISDLVANYDNYISATTGVINNFINWLMKNDSVSEYINDAAIKQMIANFFSYSGSMLDTVINYAVEYGSGLFVGIKNTLLGIFISVYVLISKEKLIAQLRKFSVAVMPEARQRKLRKYITLTHRNFSGYFIGKIIGSCIVFVLMFIMMLLLKMPYPLLISTIFAVTDIIPIFGPILGAIPSFFIIFIVDPIKALIFLVLVVAVQQLEGNVISPKILGEATGISSLSVIIAIIVMGSYFGLVGMIIGVPIFAVAITIVKEMIDTRLRRKEKPTDTAEYYEDDSVVDPHEHHEAFSKKVFGRISVIVKKIVGLFKKDMTDAEVEAKADAEASAQEDEKNENE
ncbi:MAG: AI-2E family transporter [Clostridia bacterium]|nr:AI-2E family transporter [Clostridia bacterium]